MHVGPGMNRSLAAEATTKSLLVSSRRISDAISLLDTGVFGPDSVHYYVPF